MMEPPELNMAELRAIYEGMVESEKELERKKKREDRMAAYRLYSRLGICVYCGQNATDPGHVICQACRLYRNQSRFGYTGRMPPKRKRSV